MNILGNGVPKQPPNVYSETKSEHKLWDIHETAVVAKSVQKRDQNANTGCILRKRDRNTTAGDIFGNEIDSQTVGYNNAIETAAYLPNSDTETKRSRRICVRKLRRNDRRIFIRHRNRNKIAGCILGTKGSNHNRQNYLSGRNKNATAG